MHWIGIAALAGAGVVAARWILRRTDTLGRARPFPLLGVAALVVAGAVSLTPWLIRYRLELRLGQAASGIAGLPVSVFCQSFGEAFVDTGSEYGYVEFDPEGVPEKSTLIKRQQCRDLRSYLRSDKAEPTREHAIAVHTLTHEAVHMSGVTSESETECIALQRDVETAQALGASLEAARTLASVYWQVVYPQMPPDYRSDECHPGGKLDLMTSKIPW